MEPVKILHRLAVLPLLAVCACKPLELPTDSGDASGQLLIPEPEPLFSTTCAGTGYSRDVSDAGLPVRDAPSPQARILGRLYTLSAQPEEDGSDPYAISYVPPSFRITDLIGDWVQIEGSDPVGEGSGLSKENFTGRGWIPRSMVGYAVSGPERSGRTDYAYSAPDFGAQVVDEFGALNVIHVPDEVTMIACKGSWIELRYRKRIPEPENAPPLKHPHGDGPWVTGWMKVKPYVTYQKAKP